jgi:phage tail sheath protein FI
MASYLSPGIYVRETDFSFYVKQISTAACGMVGIAERGPINKAVLVTSWEQFVKTFGGYIQHGYLAYAARAFFDNGGSVLHVCRVANYTDPTRRSTLTAVRAEAAIADRSAGVGVPTLKVRAANEGAWGNALSIGIEDGTRRPGAEFNLVVRHKGEVVEVWKDLSMDEAARNHVELAINEKSDWIVVEDADSATAAPLDRPRVGQHVLAGGLDGVAGMTDADYSGDSSQKTGFHAFDEIDALNVLCVPGVGTAEVITAGITYAEGRKDLLFIAETPMHLEPSEAVEFRRGEGAYTHAAFNSSYAALYYPWIEISDPVSGKRKLVPPTGAVAGCIARSDEKTYVWYAPAGIDRGRVFGALSVGYGTSRGERDVLYPEGINVIAVFPDTGINIWGQRTLQSQPSALDRINVRRLMMYMEEAIAESSRFVVFEPNNPQTWRALIRLVSPFLQEVKEKGGVYDFAVQCDEETNPPAVTERNEMVARIFVKPTKTAEFVELNFVLTPTGGDFKEIFSTT